MAQQNVQEVVLYQLREDQVSVYGQLTEQVEQFLRSQNGFVRRTVLKDEKYEGLFLDLVEWKSLADAKAAVRASQKERTLKAFFKATENVLHFSHFAIFERS